MYQIIRLLFFTLGTIFAVFFLHAWVNYFFFYPINQINITILFLLWFIVYKDDLKFLWIALPISIIMDLFSSLPFGVTSASVLLMLMTLRALYMVIFTNFSWYGTALLGFLSIFLFKLFCFLITWIGHIFHYGGAISFSNIYSWITEGVINSIVLLTIYLLSRLFSKKNKYQHVF